MIGRQPCHVIDGVECVRCCHDRQVAFYLAEILNELSDGSDLTITRMGGVVTARIGNGAHYEESGKSILDAICKLDIAVRTDNGEMWP